MVPARGWGWGGPKGTSLGRAPLLGSQGNNTLAAPGTQPQPKGAVDPSFLFLPAALGQLGRVRGPPLGLGVEGGLQTPERSLSRPPDLPVFTRPTLPTPRLPPLHGQVWLVPGGGAGGGGAGSDGP